MRATRAYIASLGTTGLLLAFSASLLVVVGTLFAFNAWPGADIRDAVDSLIVDDEEKRFGVAGPTQVALDSAPAALAVASAPAPGATLAAGGSGGFGSIGGDGLAPGTPGGGEIGGTGPAGGGGGGGGGGGLTSSEDPIDTGRETDQLAGTTEGVTRSLGDTVGGVNPQLGNAVSDTGQALSDIVRNLPDVKLGKNGLKIGN
jgi:hypothetical protein